MTGTSTGALAWTRPGSSDELEDLDVGDRVDDFDLLMGLGRGAFARVFLSRQRSMQRIVAVKISEDRGSEPQTLAQLDHDYIVRPGVHDGLYWNNSIDYQWLFFKKFFDRGR